MTINDLTLRLSQYDKQEARSIVRLLLSDCFNLTLTDIYTGGLESLNTEQQQLLETCMCRLEKGEPIQYVTGKTLFCEREFHVAPGVLIPRPETEELCSLITNQYSANHCPLSILDIGTGSGCIAITLALNLPNSSVSALDISLDALRIAKDNAQRLGANISFLHRDILEEASKTQTDGTTADYDVIVSNPPYICKQEAAEMEANVLEHEPHTALFVPDEEPLLFYHAIAVYAQYALKSQGRLFFEINPLYADEMLSMLNDLGFVEVLVHEDQFGKPRFVSAKKCV